MWWNQCFGSLRYKWIYDKMKRKSFGIEYTPVEEMDQILRNLVSTWNPQTRGINLNYLKAAIEMRPINSPIFSLDLVCHCVCSLDISAECHWEIVELMYQRLIPPKQEITTDWKQRIHTSWLVCSIMNRLVAEMSVMVIKDTDAFWELVKQMKNKIKFEINWKIFRILFFFLAKIRSVKTDDVELLPPQFPKIRTKCYVYLMKSCYGYLPGNPLQYVCLSNSEEKEANSYILAAIEKSKETKNETI